MHVDYYNSIEMPINGQHANITTIGHDNHTSYTFYGIFVLWAGPHIEYFLEYFLKKNYVHF